MTEISKDDFCSQLVLLMLLSINSTYEAFFMILKLMSSNIFILPYDHRIKGMVLSLRSNISIEVLFSDLFLLSFY